MSRSHEEYALNKAEVDRRDVERRKPVQAGPAEHRMREAGALLCAPISQLDQSPILTTTTLACTA